MKFFEVRHTAGCSIFDPDKEKIDRMFKAQKEMPEARLADCGFVLYDNKGKATKAIEILKKYGFDGQINEIEVAEEEEEEEEE